MTTQTRRGILSPILLATVSMMASAQPEFVPYTSDAGIELAAEYAAQNLPAGARLVLIGALGEAFVGDMPMHISPVSGEASVWAYVYYLPSLNRWKSLAVVEVRGMSKSVYKDDPPVPLPSSLTAELELSGSVSSSGAAARRLASDSLYASFLRRSQSSPTRASLHPPSAQDSALLPSGFPLDAPLWSVMFGSVDRPELMCWVASRTGDVYVLEPSSSSASEAPRSSSGHLQVHATPNPTNTVVHVAVTGTDGAMPHLELYDLVGERVLPRLGTTRTASGWESGVDISRLPTGTYVLHVESANGSTSFLVHRTE